MNVIKSNKRANDKKNIMVAHTNRQQAGSGHAGHCECVMCIVRKRKSVKCIVESHERNMRERNMSPK